MKLRTHLLSAFTKMTILNIVYLKVVFDFRFVQPEVPDQRVGKMQLDKVKVAFSSLSYLALKPQYKYTSDYREIWPQ